MANIHSSLISNCFKHLSAIELLQSIISSYSGRLKEVIKQEKMKAQISNSMIKIDDFPGGANGFELISRFCYNNGRISITPSNISVLYCSAIFLEMTEKISPCNLLQQTETFLEGLFYWSWSDILISLKSCDSFFSPAESSGLLEKLISSLLSKMSQNSDLSLTNSPSPSSSYSSPDTVVTGFRFSSSSKTTPESAITAKPSTTSTSKAWWFDELSILSPKIIEKIIKSMGFYGTDNNSLVITKFLLHYLKTAFKTKSGIGYSGLTETAVYGVVLMGKTAFSCRGLFWVQRVVSGLGLSRNCRDKLERLIGGMLEQATLDDLLVSGNNSGEVYDVNLVLRLVRVFVIDDGVTVQKMKKVGRLIDMYMGEISPDQNLKVSKFLAVAESLPDCARDCFDGVYRAIEIYLECNLNPTTAVKKYGVALQETLNNQGTDNCKIFLLSCKYCLKIGCKLPKSQPEPEQTFQALLLLSTEAELSETRTNLLRALILLQSHPTVSLEERSRLCKCLNFEKLTLEACKDLAKNIRIPPRISIQALISQQPKVPIKASLQNNPVLSETRMMILHPASDTEKFPVPAEKEELKLNLQRMQWRVMELEKSCREMKSQMSEMVKHKAISSPVQNRPLPKLF
ncbi:NPH3 domain [Macleaya cordata]|uniref:NPH3 domain n=1 Tax=Macleaya cordata TaxID=56857 RepID=A0A200QNT5_MACCD|nr:NPH3 domain [Macleaya cordata]